MTLDIKKAEKIYIGISIALILALLATFVFLLISLVKNINNSLAPRSGKSSDMIRFNIDNLENIKKKL